jgi:hypothetical protein
MLLVRFKNDGNTTARLTEAELKSYLPSGGCDLRFTGSKQMNIVIPPGHDDQAFFTVDVRPPCKTSGLIKSTVMYTNLASGLEYTQDLSASADLVFRDESAQ